MLGMFVDMTEPMIGKIQSTYDQKDFHALMELAHSLKGAARSACANILGDYAAELQTESENKKDRPDLIKNIASEFSRVQEEIANMKP